MNLDLCRRSLLSADKNASCRRNDSNDSSAVSSMVVHTTPRQTAAETLQQDFRRHMLSTMCNVPLDSLDENGEVKTMLPFGDASSHVVADRARQIGVPAADPNAVDFFHTATKFCNENMKPHSQNKSLRKICDKPYKVLDAPDVLDDYYQSNLLSWSKDNILAVALDSAVYLRNMKTEAICLLAEYAGRRHVSSLKWCPIPNMTNYLAVGLSDGSVYIYDSRVSQCTLSIPGVSENDATESLSWNVGNGWLTFGSGSGSIVNVDTRVSSVAAFQGHDLHVCGLSWNAEGTCLASGGNDDIVCLWDVASMPSSDENTPYRPRAILKGHTAAVKALDWSPFRHDILASGGGLADRTIKLWNTNSGNLLESTYTGSQVSTLLWSQTHHKELYSAHGFKKNHIVVWNHPSMTIHQELHQHEERILTMDVSPDGLSLVSLGADEEISIWDLGKADRVSRNTHPLTDFIPSFDGVTIR